MAGSSFRLLVAKVVHGLRNLTLDLRFGSSLLGVKNTRVPGHAQVVNSDYALYPHLFEHITVGPEDVVVDVGSGRGRFINWLLWRRLGGRIIGIEFDAATAEASARRLRRYRQVKIVHGDATQIIPEEGKIFFMFNPFEADLMRRFRDRFRSTFVSRGDPIIIYLRPLELDVFRETDDWEIKEYEIPENMLDERYRVKPGHRRFAVIRLRSSAQLLSGASSSLRG